MSSIQKLDSILIVLPGKCMTSYTADDYNQLLEHSLQKVQDEIANLKLLEQCRKSYILQFDRQGYLIYVALKYVKVDKFHEVRTFAQLMNVSVHQLRYFEEKGILYPLYTDENQYRMCFFNDRSPS
jgi:DNA-binding transcriptional MerR regulator